jgi:hypothetical protein
MLLRKPTTVRSESRCALRLRHVYLVVSIEVVVDITSKAFYKCTATFRTQICRKCLRIKLNGFMPVYKLVDSLSTHFISAQRLSGRALFPYKTYFIFTFSELCIVVHISEKDQQDAHFFIKIYFN